MPEALAVLFVFVVALASWVGALIHTANAPSNPAGELQRLQQQRAWLEERLQLGWRENWDQAMLTRLADEIEAIDAQLAKAAAEARRAR